MNGVVVLSTRNGACLYARRWAPNFGLRGDFGDAADSTSSELAGDDIDGASSPAAMHLSGMIFALDLDAASLARREGDAHPTAEDPTADPTIARWAVGDCALHVRKDHSLGVACVVSASVSALDDEIPGRVADALLSAFTRKHRDVLASAATAVYASATGLDFDDELVAVLAREPHAIARSLANRLGVSAPWVYAACVDDDSCVSSTTAVRPSSRRLGENSRAKTRIVKRMIGAGRRSRVTFRPGDDSPGAGGFSVGGGKGCFGVGARARGGGGGGGRVEPVDRDGGGGGGGGDFTRLACRLDAGWTRGGDDVKKVATMEAAAAVADAAIAAFPGVSTIELAMGGAPGEEGEGDEDFEGTVKRVLVFRVEEDFVVALPLTRGDLDRARRGSGGAYLDGTNASAVRASLGEDARRLGRVMRFVRSLGATLDQGPS